jgi:hypothetical protein
MNDQLTRVKFQYENVKRLLDECSSETDTVADGQITWVDQRTRTVWVNLGLDDGLRRNLTFSVYQRDENNLATAKKKGRIEITNVRNGHTSEARILEDSNTNPIQSEDLIASPVWSPGGSLRYALVGRMDINEDGRDDRELVKNLIQQFGGAIDAEDTPDGTVRGDITIHTRYLVMGERPTENTDAKLLKGYSTLVEQASRYNVEQMSVFKLVDEMGLGSRVRNAGGAGRRRPVTTPPAASPAPVQDDLAAPLLDSQDSEAAPADDLLDDAEPPVDEEPASDDEEPASDDVDVEDVFGELGSTSQRPLSRRERW